jgi:hypothetical protein
LIVVICHYLIYFFIFHTKRLQNYKKKVNSENFGRIFWPFCSLISIFAS